MNLISYLLLLVLYAAVLMIDIALVFVIIRIIVRWRPIGVLSAYNIAGRLLVDYATRSPSVEKSWGPDGGVRTRAAGSDAGDAGHRPFHCRRVVSNILVTGDSPP